MAQKEKQGGADSEFGRFEVDLKGFKVKKAKAKSSHPLDIKTVIPDLFPIGTKMPRLLKKVVRKVFDEFLTKEEGVYFLSDDSVMYVAFESLPPVGAKAKTEAQSGQIKRMMEELTAAEEGGGAQEEVAAAKKKQGDKTLAKMVRKGIQENPAEDEMKSFAERVVSDLTHAGPDVMWVSDLERLAGQSQVGYYPLWNAKNQVIAGNVCHFFAKGKAETPDEFIRRDVATFASAGMELEKLVRTKGKALVVVPIGVRTFMNPKALEIYTMALRKMDEGLRQCLIFELRNLPKEGFSPKQKGAVQALSQFCRAMIIETGVFSQPDYCFEGFRPHACGFDFTFDKVPPDQLETLMKKHADGYTKQEIKLYIKSVSSAEQFDLAVKLGFDYLSGPCVQKAGKNMVAASRFPLEQIRAQHK